MKNTTVILGMMLAVSLLFNVVAFVRLADQDGSPSPSPAQEARKPLSAERTVEPATGEKFVETLAPRARETAPLPVVSPSSKTSTAAAPGVPQSSIQQDPKVREVLQANESFNAFWKDLDRVVKVRSKFEEAKYAQTVLTATSDFLELPNPTRGQFEEAAKAAALSTAQAKKEHDAARKALPPKDKANPTAAAAYEQQKDAIDARYDSQLRSAADSLKPYLNTADARHQEFAGSASKWLRNLAPRPTQP